MKKTNTKITHLKPLAYHDVFGCYTLNEPKRIMDAPICLQSELLSL